MNRFSTMDAYIEVLPDGIHSYPHSTIRAGLLRQFPQLKQREGFIEALDPVLADLLTSPPSIISWVPEAQVHAILLAFYDSDFSGDDAGYVKAFYEINRRILRSPFYRALTLFSSPRRLLQSISSRWGALHQGSELSLSSYQEGCVELKLTFSTNLFSILIAQAYSSSFEAAVENAGGKDVRFVAKDWEPESVTFEGHWR